MSELQPTESRGPGHDTAMAEIGKTMAAHEPLQDALARMKENLEANNNLHASTRAIVGPALEIVPAGEKFSTTEIYEPVNGPTR